MLEAPPFDRELGMLYYATDTCPAGGVIKASPEDFIVEEVLADGTVVSVSGVSLAPRVGEWVWVHVVKRNVDTLKLALRIARALGLGSRDVSVGGIKDARALASQIISVRGVDASKLPRVPNVQYLGAWPMDRPVTPADIHGNKFTIVVREVKSEECARETLRLLPKMPLPNYYGYQRFGTVRPVSHLLGRALIMRDADGFLDVMFCRVFPRESESAKRARELACRGDYRKALEAFPGKFIEERAVLKGLLRGRDKWNAIMSIPLQILRVYVEAFQAYVFNLFLSRRMELGPLDLPVEGDLVEVGGQVTYYAGDLEGNVVLPLVGAGIRMPSGRVGSALARVLRELGVDAPAFLRLPRGLRAYGSYRRARLELRDFAYCIEGGAVRLQFTLPRGSYATVLLRELVKPVDPRAHGF